ncbi:hypothetical protein LOC64_16425 [Rubrivivax sp. JA1029]|uniref:hypothetical protein n=1 Tax=Rubrivivax sp. JA1029 TaxID=2894193 RepID=UPI001E495927|nr:hypothetical protein [Rubrivivax sp. JA1029]MCC9648587.1 hypothetical protein [Rubrivivax sp. JA1029]
MNNEFLLRFVLWLISGFGLTLGVLLAMLVSEFVKPSLRPGPDYVAKNEGELKVTRVEPLGITTVAGALVTISNVGTRGSLRPSDVELVFKHDGKVLFWCAQYVSREVAQGAQIVEQMLCDKVERTLLPQGTEYVVNINRFEHWK